MPCCLHSTRYLGLLFFIGRRRNILGGGINGGKNCLKAFMLTLAWVSKAHSPPCRMLFQRLGEGGGGRSRTKWARGCKKCRHRNKVVRLDISGEQQISGVEEERDRPAGDVSGVGRYKHQTKPKTRESKGKCEGFEQRWSVAATAWEGLVLHQRQ